MSFNEFDPQAKVKKASLDNPDQELGPDEYCTHTDRTLTLYAEYPKSHFHVVILPRIGPPPFTADNLRNLCAFLHSVPKDKARELLLKMRDASEEAKKILEEAMEERFGTKWGFWVGFHAAPSLEQIELHVVSKDLIGKYNNAIQYNSFHPDLGYFLHLQDVLDYFDAVESSWLQFRKLPRREYLNKRRTQKLECFYDDCGREFEKISELKEHLQREFQEKVIRPAMRAKENRKRNREQRERLEANKRARIALEKQQESKG